MTTTHHPTEITTAGDHAIHTTRDFDHPVDAVFRAMHDPELIARWVGPRGYENVECTQVNDHGGTWTLVQRATDGTEFAFRGVVHGQPTPELSVRTFEWLGAVGQVFLETMRLEDLGDGRTRAHAVSLVGTREERDGMVEAMPEGVVEGYERLDDLLATL